MKDVVVCISIPKQRQETVPCTEKIIFQVLNESETKQLARATVLINNKRDLSEKIDQVLEEIFKNQQIFVSESKNGERFSHKDKRLIEAKAVGERFFNKLIAGVKRKFAEIGAEAVPA